MCQIGRPTLNPKRFADATANETFMKFNFSLLDQIVRGDVIATDCNLGSRLGDELITPIIAFPNRILLVLFILYSVHLSSPVRVTRDF